jgi:predicted N-formylglutamate amidohydrolase
MELPENTDCSLIATDEPPPTQMLNPRGKAKVLLVCDHASNRIPRGMSNLGADESVLNEHISHDIGAYAVLVQLSKKLDAPAITANYSRLVIDLNRSLSDASVIPEISDSIRIPGNQNLSKEDRAERVHCFYTPYRMAIDHAIQGFRERNIIPAFIAIHSFTPQMLGGDVRPWQIALLWDKDPRIPVPLMENLRSHRQSIMVGDNEPYSGKHPADYTIDHHAEAAGLPHVSIEIRQDLISTAEGVDIWSEILFESLSDILANPDLYQLWEQL